MLRIVLMNFILAFSYFANAETITVKNIEELKKANASAQPGDVIVMQNGEWNNIEIKLNCIGTKDKLITIKAETAGRVYITGNSQLKIGGSYLQVEGLYFMNGFAGNDAVIKFCIDKTQIANHCRVTNTVINDFNNPKRLDENYWIAVYGKNNRIDHCSFLNKKNMGVLLAVILDDERSRENFHSIDHNYFGIRIPLASNTGETIRVGVSQHCEFNSNTLIADNFFDHCDGETEIISIKSGSNIIRNNLFNECQGSIVLRHGDNNTVENNVFLGNNKDGTGGTRIINKGQWVVNNFYYQCRGEVFRTPLAIMNGVPNSPANRYVAVSDAVIANNTYVDCTPMGLCVGSDTERSVTPVNVEFFNNIIYSTKNAPLASVHDNIDGINFTGNLVNDQLSVNVPAGFTKSAFKKGKSSLVPMPRKGNKSYYSVSDSLQKARNGRLSGSFSQKQGFSGKQMLASIQNNASSNCGAAWFKEKNKMASKKSVKIDCKNAAEMLDFMASNKNAPLEINLIGNEYIFNAPVMITSPTVFTSNHNNPISFISKGIPTEYLFQMVAGNSLQFNHIHLDLKNIQTGIFISSDITGSSNHSNFKMEDCTISHLTGTFFRAAKTSVADSIAIHRSNVTDCKGTFLDFSSETDKKGYYNVEKIMVSNNTFTNHSGQLLTMLRGGNDESTMGPNLQFSNNKVTNCNTINGDALIYNYGTQVTLIENNQFTNCNPGKSIIAYEDAVLSKHRLKNNVITGSGKVVTNKFVVEDKNTTK